MSRRRAIWLCIIGVPEGVLVFLLALGAVALIAAAMSGGDELSCGHLHGAAYERCDYAEYLINEDARGGTRPTGYP